MVNIITMKDVRKHKICSKGARNFAKRYNVNWNDFMKNGIKLDDFINIDKDNPIIKRIAETVNVIK